MRFLSDPAARATALLVTGAAAALVSTSHAQQRFQRTFDQGGGDERAVWAQPIPSGGHYMASLRDPSLTQRSTVWRLNATGVPTWARFVGMDPITHVIPVTVPGLGDGPVAVGGRDVVALSGTGTLLWARRFSAPVGDNFTRGPSVDEYSFASGGFIIAGEGQGLPALRRLGPAGGVWYAQLLRNTSVADAFYPSPPGAFNDVETLPDGFVAVGWLLVPTGGGFATRQTLVVRFGIGGNIVWAKTYRQGQYNAAWGIDIAANGDYLVVGYTKDAVEGGGTYLMRLHPSGAPSPIFAACQRWFVGFSGTRSVEELASGQILLGGTAESSGPASPRYTGALRTTNGGAVIDCLIFGGPVAPTMELGVSAMPTTDGGFIAMGDTTTFAAPGARNLYLIKQSSQGSSPGSGCHESDAPIQELVDVLCDIHNETFELLAETSQTFTPTIAVEPYTGSLLCSNNCPGDLDHSGVVDGADLGSLLASWGPVSPGSGGDLDGSGTVDGADLGQLLASWGACPG